MKLLTAIFTTMLVLILSFQPVLTQSKDNLQNNLNIFHNKVNKGTNKSQSEFNHVPKEPGHYTPEKWREVIDSTWGEGLPTETKLEIFDKFWKSVDEGYPSFYNIMLTGILFIQFINRIFNFRCCENSYCACN